jgi:hypothetical protein
MTDPAPLDALTEIASRIAAADGESYAAADTNVRDHYRTLAQVVLDWVGEDDFHWGCTSAEVAEEAQRDAYDAGWEAGFERATKRTIDGLIDGLTRLQDASMVEAETVVEIVPRIQKMGPWDDAEPGTYEPATVVTSDPEQV